MRNVTLKLWFDSVEDVLNPSLFLAAVCFSLVTDKCKKEEVDKE